MEKVELLNPYNEKQLESFNDFCLHNDLPNIAKSLQLETRKKSEQEYFKALQYSYTTDNYLLLTKENRVIDYCYIHSEKDTKKAIVTYPELLIAHHNPHFISESIDYVLNDLNMEELFLTLPTKDTSANKKITALGYHPIDTEESLTTYFIAKEEKIKTNIK